MRTKLDEMIYALVCAQDKVAFLSERGRYQSYRVGRAKQARDIAVAALTQRVRVLMTAAEPFAALAPDYVDYDIEELPMCGITVAIEDIRRIAAALAALEA